MGRFQGIDPQDLWMLSEVHFQNSKAFYEEKKPAIRAKILQPLEDLIADLAPDFLKLDPLIQAEPKRMLSRIRRDTRFTRDKTLYRENIWFCFMRQKALWPTAPVMWFEIEPDGYSYGVGCWGQSPAWMEAYRRYLRECPARFLDALNQVLAEGFTVIGENYKKAKPGEPMEELRECYQKKDIAFLKKIPRLQELSSPELPQHLRRAYRQAQPMYRCMLEIVERFTAME